VGNAQGQFVFGEFRLDRSERRLSRRGVAVPLSPKAFDTLLVLVERAGHLVTKDELMQAVWPDAFVEEIGLARNISVLRKALNQDAGGVQFIETVPKRGYRFTASVTINDGAAPDQPAPPAPATRPVIRRFAAHGAVMGVAATGLAALLWMRPSPVSSEGIASIAVLPFDRLDAPHDPERLGVGMADTLSSRLSNIRGLRIAPTREVFALEHASVSAAESGRTLGTDAVMDGTVQRTGDRVRVTVQLVRTDSGAPMWSGRFEQPFAGIFAIQEEIVGAVAGALGLRLSDEELSRMRRGDVNNVEAYQAYLKGRYFSGRRTVSDQEKAVENFERAIEISPGYALAYAGLADAYATRASRARDPVRRGDLYAKAKQTALDAVRRDPQLAEAHASLGLVLCMGDWNWAESEQALTRAIELKPNYAPARHYRAMLLAALGRPADALAEMTAAQRLDPLSLVVNADLAATYIFARQPDQAIRVATHALEMDEGFGRLQRVLTWAYQESGRFDDAVRQGQTLMNASDPESGFTAAILAYGYALGGNHDKARAMAEQLLAVKAPSGQPAPATVHAAAVFAGLGDRDRAFDLLEQARRDRDDRLMWIQVDPRFDRVRTEARYQALVRELGFQ
jgi:DNA-binding winged helix-turn-helix (wHTH) protein/TolB-like protein/tetratricopeptide (TPR) repeat protein